MNTQQARARAILILRERRALEAAAQAADAAQGWRPWLHRWFPQTTRFPMATRHERVWDWFAGMQPGLVPNPASMVEVWSRGGAKSTTVELGCVYAGTQFKRRFALYVSETQGQANKHVQSIQGKLEALGAKPLIGPYGALKGWTINLLRVEGGFNVLALGLDAAARGLKLDDFRPDIIVFDDIDGRHDSAGAVRKKVTTITESILPTGAPECAVLVAQNRITKDSIVSSLADRTADFLHGAAVHEEPALRDFDKKRDLHAELREDGTRRYVLTGGEPTWPGQDRATCQRQINTWGRGAFLREAQHDTAEVEGGLWRRDVHLDPFRVLPSAVPDLFKIGVSVDPNSVGGEGNDAAGITVGGVARQGGRLHGYLLEDATVDGGPEEWSKAAIAAFHRWQANRLIAEKNNGGEMVRITLKAAPRAPGAPPHPAVQLVNAARGKQTRAEPVVVAADEGRIHHVGTFLALEAELCTWQPGDPSPNRLDSYVHLWTDLLGLTADDKFRPGAWFPGKEAAQAAALAAAAEGNGHSNGTNGHTPGHTSGVIISGGGFTRRPGRV